MADSLTDYYANPANDPGTPVGVGTADPLAQYYATALQGVPSPVPGPILPVLGTAALQGLARTFGAPGNLQAALEKPGRVPSAIPNLPTSNQLLGALPSAWTSNPPIGPGQTLAAGAVRGITGAAPLAAFGPLAAAPALLGGGAAAGAVDAALPEGTSPLLRAGIGIPASLAGGNLVQGVERAGNALTGNWNRLGQTFSDLGLPMRTSALTSESPGTRAVAAAHAPIGQVNSDLAGVIQSAAAGAPATSQALGEFAQAQAHTWLSQMDAKTSAAWAPFDAKVPPTTPGSYQPLLTALKQINSSSDPATNRAMMGAGLQPKLTGNLETALTPKQIDLSSLVGYPLKLNEAAPTVADMQKLHSAIGDLYTRPQIVNDTGRNVLDKIYAASASGLRNVAAQNGALDEFNSANTISKQLYDTADSTISKLVKSEDVNAKDPSPEQAAQKILGTMNAGGTMANGIRTELPQVADATAKHWLAQNLVTPSEGSLPGAVTKLNPAFAAKNQGVTEGAWDKLSAEAKAALWPDPADRAKLQGVADIQSRINDLPAASPAHPVSNSALIAGIAGDAGIHAFGPQINALAHSFPHAVPIATAALGTASAIPIGLQLARRATAANRLVAALAGAKAPPSVNPFLLGTVGAATGLGQ